LAKYRNYGKILPGGWAGRKGGGWKTLSARRPEEKDASRGQKQNIFAGPHGVKKKKADSKEHRKKGSPGKVGFPIRQKTPGWALKNKKAAG